MLCYIIILFTVLIQCFCVKHVNWLWIFVDFSNKTQKDDKFRWRKKETSHHWSCLMGAPQGKMELSSCVPLHSISTSFRGMLRGIDAANLQRGDRSN